MLFEYYPTVDISNLSGNQNYIIASLLSYVKEHVCLQNIQVVQKSTLKYQIQYVDFQEQSDQTLLDQFIAQNAMLSQYDTECLK